MQYRKAPEGSSRKVEAQKQFVEAMSHRMHIDHSIKLIGKLLFGIEKASEVLNAIRPAGQPLVDDWDCLKTLVKFYGSQPLLYHRLTCLFSLITSPAGDTSEDSFSFLRKCLLFFYAGEDFWNTLWIRIPVWDETHAISCKPLQCWNWKGTDGRGIGTSLCQLSFWSMEHSSQRVQRIIEAECPI